VTDEELVLLAQRGDVEAFDQLVVRHQSAVFRAAMAALQVREDAEEVAQDSFVRAWTKLPRFRGGSSFKTWLLTITWNQALTRRRRLSSWFRRAAPLDDVAEPLAATIPQDRHLGAVRLQQEVVRAIQALSPKLRDALLLAQSGEYAYDEIAVMLGIPVGTVKWRVSEARRQVRGQLVTDGQVHERS
jgi:RNA polymerase sigma-70 factor (ECF subfamily)